MDVAALIEEDVVGLEISAKDQTQAIETRRPCQSNALSTESAERNAPVDNSYAMQVIQRARNLDDHELDRVLVDPSQPIQMDCDSNRTQDTRSETVIFGMSNFEREEKGRRTAEITSQHEVEDKEAVLVVLERVPQVDDERMVNLPHTQRVPRISLPLNEKPGESWGEGRTSSSKRRSWMMFATAFILQHFALLMYFSASSCLVCLCWTTRTCTPTKKRQSKRGKKESVGEGLCEGELVCDKGALRPRCVRPFPDDPSSLPRHNPLLVQPISSRYPSLAVDKIRPFDSFIRSVLLECCDCQRKARRDKSAFPPFAPFDPTPAQSKKKKLGQERTFPKAPLPTLRRR